MTRPQPHPTAAASATAVAADIPKREILGVPVAMTDYQGAVEALDAMVDSRERGYVCAVSVHSLTSALDDPEMRAVFRGATLVLPDGMPVVWAANLLGAGLEGRVYGPQLMLRYSERCAERGHRVWLYGGRDQGSLAQLALNLRRRLPGINIVGGYSPPFRAMTDEEEDALVDQINDARPDVLWVGIGAPKQERWMARMRDRLEVPVMCAVGAAFDFHAGLKKQAPVWMQHSGLEWLFRLGSEPRRLGKRYLVNNPAFISLALQEIWRARFGNRVGVAAQPEHVG